MVGARSGLSSITTLNGVSLSSCTLKKALGLLDMATVRSMAGSTRVTLPSVNVELDLEEVRRGGEGIGGDIVA